MILETRNGVRVSDQKLAVSEILYNVSLSLSFGDPIATSCVIFFFFFWGLDALCVPMGEGRKTFYKIGICFIYFILFYIISSKSKQSFSLNCFKRLLAASNNLFNHQRCHIVKVFNNKFLKKKCSHICNLHMHLDLHK